MFKFVALVATVVATTATIAFPANAGEVAAPQAYVRYGDLQLASADGATELKARVSRAAEHVCTVRGDKSLKAMTEAKKCAKIAEARAMPQVELALANSGTQVAENSRVTVAAH
ncbi:UrcA family protein [Sphingomonas crocodyli]|uniref:UrcA family protein n=1 Tax=Sphingomonas crocodyli TaxID=1979270 RepID=A0A437M053_9SPHN|nr:UrcA family protein [Sphingomonas crocodyli]RVT91067.1 UrcA family protein [Sphingomonas crocodyli]